MCDKWAAYAQDAGLSIEDQNLLQIVRDVEPDVYRPAKSDAADNVSGQYPVDLVGNPMDRAEVLVRRGFLEKAGDGYRLTIEGAPATCTFEDLFYEHGVCM